MTTDNTKPVINAKYVLVFAVAVLLSWTLHELAHWVAGEYLEYDMGMTLNKTFPLGGQYTSERHYQLISAAGPVFTVCEAIFVFILLMQRRLLLLYPFLFTCFYMRLFAAIISFRNPNDEARISTALGIGKFTLPIIVTAVLFILLYKVTKQYRLSTKFILLNLGLTILFSTVIILSDMFFKVRLL